MNQQPDTSTIDGKIAVMQAAMRGKRIQTYLKNHAAWQLVVPDWNWYETTYRIHPDDLNPSHKIASLAPEPCPRCSSSVRAAGHTCPSCGYFVLPLPLPPEAPPSCFDPAWLECLAKPPPPTLPLSILAEAERIISGPKRESYGPVEESFERAAAIWSAVLRQTVTPSQVALCMIGLKLCRESNKADYENRVDLAGYTALLDIVENKKAESKKVESTAPASP